MSRQPFNIAPKVPYFHMILTAATCFTFSYHAEAAANFNVIPAQVLPTKAYPGETVYAYYLVTNNTNKTLSGYTVQGLPSFVTQDTQTPSYCSNPITLGAHTSCILQLNITGSVNSHFSLCKGSSCTQSAAPLHVRQQISAPPMVAAGYYVNTTSNYYPITASSFDGGATWAYTIDSNIAQSVPDYFSWDVYNPSPFSASCSEQHCVFTGAYEATSGAYYTLIAQNPNAQSDWDYVMYSATEPSTPPPASVNSFLNSASCTGKSTCIVAGQQYTGYGQGGIPPGFAPLIATSSNAGKNWSYAVDATNINQIVSDYYDFGIIGKASASCSGTHCIAVGCYDATTPAPYTTYPLLLSSHDGGTTWTSPVNGSNIRSYVTDYTNNNFGNNSIYQGANCFGETCAAAGKYLTNSSQFYYPLVMISKDGGTNWNVAIDSNTPELPIDYLTSAVNEVLNSVSCSGQACAAGGQYLSMSGPQYPLLAASSDGGTTWTYKISNNITTLLLDYQNEGSFNSVSCSGLTCIAAGQYQSNDNKYYPLLITSSDGGNIWNVEIARFASNLPASYQDGGIFNSASCVGQYCIAGGQYNNGTQFYPWIAVSNDSGISWKFNLDSQTAVSVPNDYNSNGNVTGTSISSN